MLEVRVECSGLGGGLDMDGGVVVMGWARWFNGLDIVLVWSSII